MALCYDCVARGQCGNNNVMYCASYIKEVPTKWDGSEQKTVVELLKSITREDIIQAFEDTVKTIETMPPEDFKKLCGETNILFKEQKNAEQGK